MGRQQSEPKKISSADLQALRAQFPTIAVDAVIAAAEAADRPKRFSQEDVAAQFTPFARVLAAAYPGLGGTFIGSIIRAQFSGSGKLTSSFDRSIASDIKQTRKAAATPVRSSGAKAKKVANGGAHEQASEVSADPQIAGSGGAVTDAIADVAHVADASGVRAAAPVITVQPSMLGGEVDGRPYRFTGNFAGAIYKTGYREVGTFFDTIKNDEPMPTVFEAARAVRASAKATAALTTLHPIDRAIYDAVIAAMPQ